MGNDGDGVLVHGDAVITVDVGICILLECRRFTVGAASDTSVHSPYSTLYNRMIQAERQKCFLPVRVSVVELFKPIGLRELEETSEET